MALSYFEKLRQEIARYYNQDFLNATMAVCALVTVTDEDIAADELYNIKQLTLNDPALQDIDARKAEQKLQEFLEALARERAETVKTLSDKVARMAGEHKRARTLMRVAYLVIVADHAILASEREEFERLCGLLDLDPVAVWDELANRFLLHDDPNEALLVRVPASETARILNHGHDNKWRAFEEIEDAKAAAAALFQRAIEHHEAIGAEGQVADLERRLAALPGLSAKEIPCYHEETEYFGRRDSFY